MVDFFCREKKRRKINFNRITEKKTKEKRDKWNDSRARETTTMIMMMMINLTLIHRNEWCTNLIFFFFMRMNPNMYLPHILSGASSSSNIGCDKNISRDFKHNPRISDSVSCTFFPGLEPRTKRRKWRKEKRCIGKI